MAETKPKGLTPAQEEVWENGPEGARRLLVWSLGYAERMIALEQAAGGEELRAEREDETRRAAFLITHPRGLHARFCARLCRELAGATTDTEVSIGREGERIVTRPPSVLSPARLLSLRLRCGETLEVEARGPNAEGAIAAVGRVLEASSGPASSEFFSEVADRTGAVGVLEDAERYGLVGPADQKSKGDAA